ERLDEYEALIDRLSEPLHEDCARLLPVDGAYSPFGVFYGTPSNLTEHMALKTIDRDAVTRIGLEYVFVGGDAEKLAWVNGWRKLPHIDPEVQRQHEYPQRFAEEIFARIEHELGRPAADAGAAGASRAGRLFVVPEDDPEADAKTSSIPDLPVRYI